MGLRDASASKNDKYQVCSKHYNHSALVTSDMTIKSDTGLDRYTGQHSQSLQYLYL